MYYFKGGMSVPVFYRWLIFLFILWNTVYLSGLLRIELKKKNYYGFVGICLLLGAVYATFLANFVNF